MKCRHCQNKLDHIFLDLGFSPPSNALLNKEDLTKGEVYLPLRVFVCERCWLVQTEDYSTAAELFTSEYVYFSSISKTWLAHAEQYANMITQRLNLTQKSLVIEIASNDGYLLKNFLAKNIPCLGVEPTKNTADAATSLGIPVINEFFGTSLADKIRDRNGQADLIIGNNVFAHVPDINDFASGMRNALKPNGTITLEFPHLLQLIGLTQFDTVYHEHYSYLSLRAVCGIFAEARLKIYDVEKLPTHGGSLRVYGCHEDAPQKVSNQVEKIIEEEENAGLFNLTTYATFQDRANAIKNNLVSFLIQAKEQGKKVVGYGAAAKGCTLLNYAGLKPDLLPAIFDAAPSKQGKFLPGCHIPVADPEHILAYDPDYVLILPWNIKDEIIQQLTPSMPKKTQYVVAVPRLTII